MKMIEKRIAALELARQRDDAKDRPLLCLDTPDAIAAYRARWGCDPIALASEDEMLA